MTAQKPTGISIGAAWTAIVAAILYQLMLGATIFLKPDLEPTLWAVSYTALFIAIRPQLWAKMGRTGLVLLLICVVGTYSMVLFTTDPLDGYKVTTTGILHTILGTTA